jgi:tetrahydromethanopterin S-methyltransferase subunit D
MFLAVPFGLMLLGSVRFVPVQGSPAAVAIDLPARAATFVMAELFNACHDIR